MRGVVVAPLLAFLALAAWGFASPVGASPDDDFHLTSIWCASGGSAHCADGPMIGTRVISAPLSRIACFAFKPEESARCQDAVLPGWDSATVETDRGNFYVGEYPPVYYATMHLLAGADLQVSALAMRLVNAALFVALATLLAILLPSRERPTLLWGWFVTLVPLGMFLIPSNNPSGWAITGVGTAFLALLGWHSSTGRRRWALAGMALLGVVMAGGSRGDTAVYVAGAMLVATIIAGPWRARPRSAWWRWAWLPVVGIAVSVVFFATAGQSSIAGVGFGSPSAIPGGSDESAPTGLALIAYNLLMLPFLWTGVWGTWALGWLDTGFPDIVPWSAASAFIVLAFVGIGRLDVRKAIAASGVLAVLIAVPMWVLTRSGNVVGENLHPRYLLPLIVLLAFVLLTMPSGARLRLTRVQTAVVLGALALANFVALQVNIRRYVTGIDEQGFNLDAGAEWWWTGFPVGPTWVWLAGAAAFAGLLIAVWPELRRPSSEPDGQAASDSRTVSDDAATASR